MQVHRVTDNKKDFLDLLLLGDEQEDMIDRYLSDGEMFIMEDPDTVAVAVVAGGNGDACELKNLAVASHVRRRGYGRRFIEYLASVYAKKYAVMHVGTGETPSILQFYKSCGFETFGRVPGFFTDHYDHPIIEEGIVLKDMVYLEKTLGEPMTINPD